jgi:L-threonine synthase (EC 4.2.3.1)
VKYISTRGRSPALNFEDVLLTGLASDGGLYVPDSLPYFSADQIRSWRTLTYAELAGEILYPFVEGTFSREELDAILGDTYRVFRHGAVAPLTQVDRNQWVLELFHGPTLAFKDFALQLLGRLLDEVLKRRDEKIMIMGATSGDTGSAAIEGCKRCSNIDIFILHPHQRVSDVQRKQMTTVVGDSIHNLAVKGNFDDCQALVKATFNNRSGLPQDRGLVAVNSINWARIMAQIVYYFYSAVALGAPDRAVSFSVPTGNFGDIFAGYLAKKMGLPIETLVIATNKNDVLHRMMASGVYTKSTLEASFHRVWILPCRAILSVCCSMYMVVTAMLFSNYLIPSIRPQSSYLLPQWRKFAIFFKSSRVDDAQTCQEIQRLWSDCAYLADPHTAIGIAAAREHASSSTPMVTLATAHAAKFPAAIEQAGIGVEPPLPEHLADLFERPERFDVIENDLEQVQAYMSAHLVA